MEILRKNRPSATLFNRRGFLTGVGATLLQGALIQPALARSRFASAHNLGGYPFTLGVASGDPLPDGIVLWTRLAPDPLRGGGMPHHAITVEWQIATDERMKKIVQRGATLAVPQLGHSVHVEVHGLKPSRWYWYRFKVGNEESPIGRTRTAPPRGAHVHNLRFAFVSCQQFAEGYYPALRRLSEEDLDFAIHLGDYIYEDTPRPDIIVRTHLPDVAEIFTIEDYRIRHAQYKSDPAVQAVHAAFP